MTTKTDTAHAFIKKMRKFNCPKRANKALAGIWIKRIAAPTSVMLKGFGSVKHEQAYNQLRATLALAVINGLDSEHLAVFDVAFKEWADVTGGEDTPRFMDFYNEVMTCDDGDYPITEFMYSTLSERDADAGRLINWTGHTWGGMVGAAVNLGLIDANRRQVESKL
ncbi:hypothetical protein [Shewanella algae]|uniref:hypothetical protein n=1 Tax=Shewanella algae TaxID=38313 RepID=UPI0031F5330D